jgi:dienelactone hydrolase
MSEPARRRAGSPTAVASVALVLAMVAVAACSADRLDRSATTTSQVVEPVPVDYSGRGPYPVGFARLSLPDREVVVFYPADGDRLEGTTPVTGYTTTDVLPEQLRGFVPPEFSPVIELDAHRDPPANPDGPFPLVLYSHGFGGFNLVASQQAEHLASWGFVVAAPEHKERDLLAVALGQVDTQGDPDVRDLRNTRALLEVENTRSDSPLLGTIDLAHVAVIGHSAGGRAAGLLAMEGMVDTWIGQAPVAPLPRLEGWDALAAPPLAERLAAVPPPGVPSMIIAAQDDGAVPLADVQEEFSWLAPPKTLAVLAGAGHNAFTDLCAPIREQGGLTRFADVIPAPVELLQLGEDGCTESSPDPRIAYDVIDHLMTAQLRWVFGFDPAPVSLSPAYVESLFPGALSTYETIGRG